MKFKLLMENWNEFVKEGHHGEGSMARSQFYKAAKYARTH